MSNDFFARYQFKADQYCSMSVRGRHNTPQNNKYLNGHTRDVVVMLDVLITKHYDLMSD